MRILAISGISTLAGAKIKNLGITYNGSKLNSPLASTAEKSTLRDTFWILSLSALLANVFFFDNGVSNLFSSYVFFGEIMDASEFTKFNAF